MIFDSNGKTRIDDDRLLKLLLRTILSDFTAKFPEAFLIVRDDIKPQIASCSKAPPGNQAWPKDSQTNIRFVIDVFSASRLPTGEAMIECRRVPVKRIEKNQ